MFIIVLKILNNHFLEFQGDMFNFLQEKKKNSIFNTYFQLKIKINKLKGFLDYLQLFDTKKSGIKQDFRLEQLNK